VLGKKYLFFDGGMGTVLQNKGLKLGELPEIYNFTHSDTIETIHREYLTAGAHFVTTNTFGANVYKMQKSAYTVEEVIFKAVQLAKNAKVDFPSRKYKIRRFTIRDDHQFEKNYLTLEDIIIYSSNIGTLTIANRLSAEQFYNGYLNFGL